MVRSSSPLEYLKKNYVAGDIPMLHKLMMFWSSSSLLNLDDEEVESRNHGNVLRYSVDRVILYFQSNIFLPWRLVKWRFFFGFRLK